MKCHTCKKPNPGRAPTCFREKCVRGYASWRAEHHVRKEGTCEVWLGCIRKGGVAYHGLRYADDKRISRRVLDLRQGIFDPRKAGTEHRYYRSECGTPGCVVIDHHTLVKKTESFGPKSYLPVLPLRTWIQTHYKKPLPREVSKSIWQSDRIALLRADEICCDYLGVHPFAVYGQAFYAA